ncbi:hypothetical protein [Janthinobacterium sp. J1-1]|uniref:hypothetical protein n=1 Tax=Janthinobacterium sp. J1-1 TaxID=3065910 RepID=UPI002811C5E5|nr:hypothetical protein [Janthinobacterium sp. J1-1]
MTISPVEFEAMYVLMGINIFCSGFAGFIGTFFFRYEKSMSQFMRIDSLPMPERKLAQEIYGKKNYEVNSPTFFLGVVVVSTLFVILMARVSGMTMLTADIKWFKSAFAYQIILSWIAGIIGVIFYKFVWFIFCHFGKLEFGCDAERGANERSP